MKGAFQKCKDRGYCTRVSPPPPVGQNCHAVADMVVVDMVVPRSNMFILCLLSAIGLKLASEITALEGTDHMCLLRQQ